MRRSRLARYEEKVILTRAFYSLFGIIFLLLLFFGLGPAAFVKISLLLPNASQKNEERQNNNSLPPLTSPRLEPLGAATNSAKITIKGAAQKGLNVELFLNSQAKGKVIADSGDRFIFSNISLTSGENRIYVKAGENDKLPLISEEISLIYKDKPPKLEVFTPFDGETITEKSAAIKITGQVEEGVNLTINNHQVIIHPDGNFEYQLTPANGENTIKIVARDEAGNQTEIIRKIIYSPSD